MNLLHRYLREALPLLPSDRLVDLLDFIATQHAAHLPGKTDTDNTCSHQEIAKCCHSRPFVLSEHGIKSFVDLVRFAEAACIIEGNPFALPLRSFEYQMWDMLEGALNTAAAIVSFDRDAMAFFEAINSPRSIRGKYLRRAYARNAMQQPVEGPVNYSFRFRSILRSVLAVAIMVCLHFARINVLNVLL